ncbi:MAG: hypothetical protein R2710_22650 [Acidimicrobiales bacterium]
MDNSEETSSGSSGADVSVEQRRAAAAESVEAILGDLRHVVGRMPHDDWPAMATAVLEHHDPPIADDLLGADHVGLQAACRGALAALADNDYVRAKASIEDIRRFEVRLGLELEDIRTDDPA